MLGAIIGDIIGSSREGYKTHFDDSGEISGYEKNAVINPVDDKFYRYSEVFHEDLTFTDDSVLMLATGYAIINHVKFEDAYREFFEINSIPNEMYKGPGIGYGMMFMEWAGKPDAPAYGSFGNGSGMRVPAVAYLYDTLPEVLNSALRSAECTHNHSEGIKGAQAVASAVWLARKGFTQDEIMSYINLSFYPEMDFDEEYLIRHYVFNPTCQGSIPQSIWLALTSTSFEDAMIRCLKVGGDTDTICSMVGAIVEPLFGIPKEWQDKALRILERDGPFLFLKYGDLVRHLDAKNQKMNKPCPDDNVETEELRKNIFWRALFKKILKMK
jgi:ADP-ribosylglycohydrolase